MAAAADQGLIVLNALPEFKGNPLPREKSSFRPGTDVRTFLRALDSYFTQHNIVEDAAKIRILYSRIHKTSGDAVKLANMYIENTDITYRQLEQEFLAAYPNAELTEIQVTTKKIKDLRIFDPSPLCCLLYTSPSPRDKRQSRMPSSA